jgi:hypothetical protein
MPGRPLASSTDRPRGLKKPFSVEGSINDAELVLLVDFVRSNPKTAFEYSQAPDGTETWKLSQSIDGAVPILSIVK